MGTDSGGVANPALDQASLLLRQGDPAQAEAIALHVAGNDPACARAWFLLGAARHLLKHPEAAFFALERALALDPDLHEARRACATILLELKRPREALAQIEGLLRRRPAETDFLVDAGVVLEELGEPVAALARYDAALRRAKGDFRARLNRGALLARLDRLEEALRDNQTLVRAHVGSAAAHYNLADVLLRLDRHAEALAAAERALSLQPEAANILMLRGLALAMLGRDAEARASFDRARSVDAAAAGRYRAAAAAAAGVAVPQRLTLDPRQIRFARLLERQKACDWRERGRLIEGMRTLAAELRRTPFPLEETGLYHTALSLPLTAADQQALAQGIALAAEARAAALTPRSFPAGGSGERSNSKRIRLGFISSDFREHPAAQLHWRQLAGHDRRQFEVFGYSLLRGEGPLRERIVEACDTFREVSELDIHEIATRIALDDIDILVDLTGHLDHSRPEVLAMKPAPLRVSYLGLPATMGADLVDYRITDAFATPPEEESFWSEKLVFLPDTLSIYNDRETIAEAAPSRSACGLPEHGFVFCCFNAGYKIEPDVFEVWMRLLARVPGSVLWLLDGGEAARSNLWREAAARSIAPERLVFAPRLPRAEHLARHACADLFLDTFYCNAHTTAADALWAGLPVLTCAGETMASRIGASIVHAIGLPELVAPDSAAYQATALRLATQPGELATLRERLARKRSTCALFDTTRRVRELDRAFEMMWQRHLDGLPPESFAVPPEAGGDK
jgi:predicted O-linked N-acetylglucosamine transferase (SPINDLY family)